MAKELVYRVRIEYDTGSAKGLSKINNQVTESTESLTRGQQRVQQSTKDVLQEIRREISLLELLEQTGGESTGRLEERIESLNATLATAPEQTEKVIAAQKRLGRLSNRLGSSTESVTSQTRNYARAQSNANQVLFSYGDLINDAQQFQFGFSNGLRAIGNNIGFAAEGISNLNTRAGGFRNTLKTLGSSLLGPGGIILGINVAVTALTVFGDKLFGTNKRAEELNESLKQTSDFFEEIATQSVDEFVEQTEGVDRQIEAISKAINTLFAEEAGLQGLPTPMQQLNTAAASATATFQNNLAPQIAATNQALDRTELINQKVREETRQILINKKAELEAQQLVNEALRNALRVEQQIQGITATAQISIQTIGGDAITPEQQAANEARRQAAQETQRQLDDIATMRAPEALNSINEVALRGVDAVRERVEFSRDAIFAATEAAGMAISALFGRSKAAAIADAVVQGALAVQRALASAPPPLNFIIAGTVAAATAAQIAKIQNTEIGSGGGGGGGGIRSSGTTEGFNTSSVSRASGVRGVNPRAGGQPNIVVEANNVLPDTEFSVRADNGRKQRVSNVRKVEGA